MCFGIFKSKGGLEEATEPTPFKSTPYFAPPKSPEAQADPVKRRPTLRPYCLPARPVGSPHPNAGLSIAVPKGIQWTVSDSTFTPAQQTEMQHIHADGWLAYHASINKNLAEKRQRKLWRHEDRMQEFRQSGLPTETFLQQRHSAVGLSHVTMPEYTYS